MSTSTRKIMRGEIYYIKNFPTCGHEQRSGRPAVIVSNDMNNAHSEVVEVCYLTLKEKTPLPTHVFIDRGPCMNSTVLCEQITSVSLDRVGDYMCRIPEHLEEALNDALVESIALRPIMHITPEEASGHERTPDSYKVEIQSLKNENEHLYKEVNSALKELELVKDANNTIKEKAASNLKALDSANARADMYERMYNDLLDKIIRGAK